MTFVYITIDTEYSSGLFNRDRAAKRETNFDRSIAGKTAGGSVGVGYQMDVFDQHGLKGVFFIDPMPALIWGVEAIADIVGPIVKRGHDVQLHLHSEWLEFAGKSNPLGGKTGRNIKDFSREEQLILLSYAKQMLIAAGAPELTAFRAGNYGANDDTLSALAELGMAYDTSHCPGIAHSECDISLGPNHLEPLQHHGLIEVPIGAIASRGNGLRHAQITALTASELLEAIRFSHQHKTGPVTIVSHSFELLSRDRQRINTVVKRRFDRFCAGLAAMQGVTTATYAAQPPKISSTQDPVPVLPHSLFRTGYRMAEQAVSNALYGAK